jgi:hypothetical protein
MLRTITIGALILVSTGCGEKKDEAKPEAPAAPR